jgi:5'-nucleotidase/UDP-sugar diphosphatase
MGTNEGTKQGGIQARIYSRRGRVPSRRSVPTILALLWLAQPACDEAEPRPAGQNLDAAVPDAAPDRVLDAPFDIGGDTREVSAPANTSTVTILHTNDLHSHLWGHSPEADYSPGTVGDDLTVGGFARLASAVKTARTSQDSLLVDGGDFLMGTLFHWAGSTAAPELKLMHSLGYDAATIGNHEFDFTPAGLAAVVSAARTGGVTFPLLASNMKFSDSSADDDSLAALRSESGPIRTKLIKTLPNGLKVGLFGLLGEEAQRFAAPAKPITFDPIATAAAAMVRELRETDQVHLVVALSHSGITAGGTGEDRELAKMVPGIDVIVSGHTHDKLTEPVVEGKTIIVTAGSYGEYLGRLELDVGWTGLAVTKLEVKSYQLIPINDTVTGDAEAQAAVDAYVAGLDAALAPASLSYKKVVAETAFDLKRADLAESGLGDLIADAYLAIGRMLEPTEPADFAVEANGQIRADLLKGQTGRIWFSDLYQVTPLGIGPDQKPGTPLISYYLTGAEIFSGLEVGAAAETPPLSDAYFLQVAGIEVDYQASRPLFQRVTGARIVKEGMAPQAVSPAGCYKVVSTHYLAAVFGLVETLTGGARSVKPRLKDCQVVITDLFSRRIDANPGMAEVQELKQYQAVLGWVGAFADTDAVSDMIPDVPARYMASQQRIKRTP